MNNKSLKSDADDLTQLFLTTNYHSRKLEVQITINQTISTTPSILLIDGHPLTKEYPFANSTKLEYFGLNVVNLSSTFTPNEKGKKKYHDVSEQKFLIDISWLYTQFAK